MKGPYSKDSSKMFALPNGSFFIPIETRPRMLHPFHLISPAAIDWTEGLDLTQEGLFLRNLGLLAETFQARKFSEELPLLAEALITLNSSAEYFPKFPVAEQMGLEEIGRPQLFSSNSPAIEENWYILVHSLLGFPGCTAVEKSRSAVNG